MVVEEVASGFELSPRKSLTHLQDQLMDVGTLKLASIVRYEEKFDNWLKSFYQRIFFQEMTVTPTHVWGKAHIFSLDSELITINSGILQNSWQFLASTRLPYQHTLTHG